MNGRVHHAEITVIGAGVIGASIAAKLHRAGAELYLVDAGIPGEGVSGASFAWVNSSPDKSPESYRLLNLLGLEAHHRLHSRGEAHWFHPTGSLAIGHDDEGGPRTAQSRQVSGDGHSDLGGRAPARVLEPSDIAGEFPYLADDIAGVVSYPRDGWVDIRRMLFDLVSTLPTERVLTASPVHRVTPSVDGTGATVELTDGTFIRSERVVLANGNGATPLVEQLSPGLELIDPESEATHVGLVVETDPVDEPLTAVIRAHGVSIRPTRDGGVIIADHATAASYAISDPALWDVPKVLIRRAEELAPGLGDLRVRSVRIGARVWPRDGRTVCGWIADGVYVVLTHSGVTLAPYLAECVRTELEGGSVADLADYRPERFMEGHVT